MVNHMFDKLYSLKLHHFKAHLAVASLLSRLQISAVIRSWTSLSLDLLLHLLTLVDHEMAILDKASPCTCVETFCCSSQPVHVETYLHFPLKIFGVSKSERN